MVENALRDFRLGGVDLPPAEKVRFKAIMQRLSELGSKFQQQLLDATQAWHKHVPEIEALRHEVYEAYVTRASELGPQAGQFDNQPVMAEILALRHEAARLIGFANYAEESLFSKMAPDVASVTG